MKAILSVVMSFAVLTLVGMPQVSAQQKGGGSAKDLVGTWTIVSNNGVQPDGKKFQPFGANPVGMLMFDSGGRYSLQICSSGRPKFASNNRVKGTPEEYKSATEGCNPHWGKYSVEGSAIVFNIEHSMFPNWEGIQQKRAFTVAGDDMKYTVPSASGGGVVEVHWRRVK
jgi:hypothetical protein